MNHEILRTVFLPQTANDCFFLCQETCAYAKTTALMCLKIDSRQVQNKIATFHSLQQSFFKDLEI